MYCLFAHFIKWQVARERLDINPDGFSIWLCLDMPSARYVPTAREK